MTAVKEACWNRGTRYDERWQISRSPKTGVLAYGVKRVKRDLYNVLRYEALILGLLCCILGDAFESGDADGAIGSYDLRVQNRRTLKPRKKV